MIVVPEQWCTDPQMWCCECCEVYWLYSLEPPFAMEETDGISSHQTTQRVSYNTNLLDALSLCCQLFQLLLNLLRDSFTAKLDAIVCEAAGIAFGDEDVKFVFGILFVQRGGEVP